jgi:hypothetical protein
LTEELGLEPITIKRIPAGLDIEEEANSLDWDTDANKWSTIDQTFFDHFPNSEMGTLDMEFINNKDSITSAYPRHVKVIKLLREIAKKEKKSIPIINIILGEEIKSNLIIGLNTLLETLRPKLEELLGMMIFTPYSDDQIARAAQNLFALVLHSPNYDGNFVSDLDATQKAFGDECRKLAFSDKANIDGRGVVPISFFDKIPSMTSLRKIFNGRYPDSRCQLCRVSWNRLNLGYEFFKLPFGFTLAVLSCCMRSVNSAGIRKSPSEITVFRFWSMKTPFSANEIGTIVIMFSNGILFFLA